MSATIAPIAMTVPFGEARRALPGPLEPAPIGTGMWGWDTETSEID
ncbi:hypothetical protein GCM10009786_13900 [Leucobacter alluvii]|uniref:Uncharacterized protein n=1 Tax=Leucobacter alluvii TaxID=340321 RepID=A0ABP5MWR6_9MICO